MTFLSIICKYYIASSLNIRVTCQLDRLIAVDAVLASRVLHVEDIGAGAEGVPVGRLEVLLVFCYVVGFVAGTHPVLNTFR